MGGIGHTFICLDSCAIGVWLGTFGVAALLSCTTPCVFCCISCNFAFGGRSVTRLMGHGTMSRLMFGLIKATQLPRGMRERMRQMCVCYAAKSAPPSHFCGECQEHYCDKCIDAHTCGEQVAY